MVSSHTLPSDLANTFDTMQAIYNAYPSVVPGCNEAGALSGAPLATVRRVMWGTVFGGGAPYIENVSRSDANGELGSRVTKEIDAFFYARFYARPPLGSQTRAPQFWRMRPQKNLVSPQTPAVNKYVLATDDGLDVLVYADTTASFNVTAPSGVTRYMYRWFSPSKRAFSSWQLGSTWQFAAGPPAVLQLDAAAIRSMGGVGDYNGDGTLDIAWRRRYAATYMPAPPMNSAWLMQPGSWASTPTIATSAQIVDAQANNPTRSTPSRDDNWVMVGTPDWDHDGTPDVLWRNELTGSNDLWYMTPAAWQGGPVVATAVLPAKSDIYQQLVGSVDFDGDGQVDLLWRHRISGALLIEYMTGTTIASSVPLPTAGRDWEAQAVGDFNADGVPDIVWRHRFTHNVAFWHLARDGTVAARGSVQLPTPLDSLGQIIKYPRWQIVGAGDFDSDGNTDLLWRNRATGQNIVWKMSGTTYVSGVVAPSAQ
jgi:hypothetical protein